MTAVLFVILINAVAVLLATRIHARTIGRASEFQLWELLRWR